jgi:hydrogenase maturation factor HypE
MIADSANMARESAGVTLRMNGDEVTKEEMMIGLGLGSKGVAEEADVSRFKSKEGGLTVITT